MKIIHANNLDPLLGLPSLEDKSVDHTITDPPYSAIVHKGGLRTGAKYAGGSASVREDFGFEHLTDAHVSVYAQEMVRVTRGWLLVFCDVESTSRWRNAIEATGAKYKASGIWIRENTAPKFDGTGPAMGAEAVAIAWCGPGKSRWNGGGLPAVWSAPIVISRGNGEERCHPTQKPVALLLRLIYQFSDPGDLILDPFAGSGTIGVACNMTDRDCILIEMNEDHIKTCHQRTAGGRQKQMFLEVSATTRQQQERMIFKTASLQVSDPSGLTYSE